MAIITLNINKAFDTVKHIEPSQKFYAPANTSKAISISFLNAWMCTTCMAVAFLSDNSHKTVLDGEDSKLESSITGQGASV